MAEEVKSKKTTARKAATKTAGTSAAPRKRAVKKSDEVATEEKQPIVEVTVEQPVEITPVKAETSVPAGRYLFSTGRRKSAIANIRLFEGKGQNTVNKKPFETYFSHGFLRDEALQAFKFAGMSGQYYFTATVNGGGIKAQAQAVRHGIAQSLAGLGEEVRRVLKKNGLLTRDPREKERKKPGLRRARRAPQWAKR
jgi:small subunit ribosomal protein S9